MINNQQDQYIDSSIYPFRHSSHSDKPKEDQIQLPFHSPAAGFPPIPFPQFPTNFNLNQPYKDYDDLEDQFQKRNNPLRKVSDLQQHEQEDDHIKMQQQQFQQYYYPYRLPFMPYHPLMKFNPQNAPYKMMAPMYDGSPYQGISTVSKELSTKVYYIVSQTSVSQFQCNCKKSKCLKLYCECFANGQVCSQSCNCQDCKNRIDNPQERQKAIEEALIRNNEAFNNILNSKSSEKDIKTIYPKPETPNSGIEKKDRKGCNCKKSSCKKKYCECFSASLTCNDLCKCENCQNGKVQSQMNNSMMQKSNNFLKTDNEQQQLSHQQQNNQMIDNLDREEQHLDIDIKRISSRSKKIKKENEESAESGMKIQIKNVWTKKNKIQQQQQQLPSDPFQPQYQSQN